MGVLGESRGLKDVRLKAIKLLEELKEILAVCDYGLAPIFSHAAGTFLKVLAYIASGLHIIASPQSLQGIDPLTLRNRRVFVVRDFNEYKNTVIKAITLGPCAETRHIITCHERDTLLRRHIRKLINYIINNVRNTHH